MWVIPTKEAPFFSNMSTIAAFFTFLSLFPLLLMFFFAFINSFHFGEPNPHDESFLSFLPLTSKISFRTNFKLANFRMTCLSGGGGHGRCS